MKIKDAFASISKQVLDATPKIEAMTDETTDVMIESAPLTDKNGVHVGLWGPWKDQETAQLYLRAKRDRNRIRAAAHFEAGGAIEHDGHHFCHPEFRYRFLPLREYYMRVLAQIIVNSLAGMVQSVCSDEDFDTYENLEESFGPDLDGKTVEGT